MEFYSKYIEDIPDKWQEITANNGGYVIELNVNCTLFSKNKFDIQNR